MADNEELNEEIKKSLIDLLTSTKELTEAQKEARRVQKDVDLELSAFHTVMSMQKNNILTDVAKAVARRREMDSQINVMQADINATKDVISKRKEIDASLSSALSTAQEAENTQSEVTEVRRNLVKNQIEAVKEYRSAVAKLQEDIENADTPAGADVLKSMLAQKMEQLSKQEEELAERKADYKKENSALSKLIAKTRGLTDQMEKNKKELENNTEKLQDQERELEKLNRQRYAESMMRLANILKKTGKALEDLIKTVRSTQQQLGITGGQAVQLQITNLVESFRSTATSILTLGRNARASSEEIMAAQTAFQAEFGGVLTSEAAGNLAIQAKELGVSTEAMANARRQFMTTSMGDLGDAQSQQERIIAGFKEQGLTAKDAFQAVAQNSELFARNGTRFERSFIRAAAEAKKIGVDLSKIDQVGDNIIGNFEGFLEKSAELGAMGFNLDTSSLAEIAETGDTGALMGELRSQLAATGKDITNLRRSEQLALSEAFGIPMAELQRLTAPERETGSGEETVDPQIETNSLLSRAVNFLEGLAPAISALGTLIAGTVAVTSGITAANTTVMAGSSFFKSAGRGISSAVRGGARLLGRGGSAIARGGRAVGRGVLGAGRGVLTAGGSAASGLATTMGTGVGAASAGTIGTTIAAGLAGGLAIGEGINKLTGSYGLTDMMRDRRTRRQFEQRDSDEDERREQLARERGFGSWAELQEANRRRQQTPEVPVLPTEATQTVIPETPTQPPPVVNVDLAPLMAKLDGVVNAISGMQVQMDANKVGEVVVNNERRMAQSGAYRAQRTG